MYNLSRLSIKPKISQGFTLIEVLVASFILFLVISTMTMVYRGAMLSSHKSERVLKFTTVIEPIAQKIRIQIQSPSDQGGFNGNGVMGDITYSWSATKAQESKAPLVFDLELGEVSSGNKTYSLWDITLELKANGASRQYQFNEVSW